MSARKLDGKVAVITGGNSGIGLATARLFAREGAKVFITGRRKEQLDTAVAEIGNGAVAVQGDVAKNEDLDRLYAAVKERAGRVDVVFANAGTAEFAPLGRITEDHYYRLFDTNVKGLIFTVQKALPLFQGAGSVILNASTVASTGNPAFSIYSATKGAVRNIARSWILDLKGTGIRVNVLSPGLTSTPGLLSLAETTGDKDAALNRFLEKVPLGRIGSPDETAKAALFLASDDSSYVNGSELFVDGGSAQF